MTHKYVIYEDPLPGDPEIFERFGEWWFAEEDCERPHGPYGSRLDAEESADHHKKWLAEIELDEVDDEFGDPSF